MYAVAGDREHVIKLFLPGFESNAAKERDIADRLEAMGVTAPRVTATVEVNGRSGLVMDRVNGKSLLDFVKRRPWTARSAARILAELHVALHRASGEGLRPLAERLRGQIENAPALSDPERKSVLETLNSLPAGDRICHGDFHPDNVLLGDHGPVTIDWNDAAAGPPIADVARTVVLLRIGSAPGMSILERAISRVLRAVLVSAYLRRYGELAGLDRAELRKWLTGVAAARLADGIEGEQEGLLRVVRQGVAAG